MREGSPACKETTASSLYGPVTERQLVFEAHLQLSTGMVASAGPRTQVAFTAIPVCGAPRKCWWVGGGRRAAGEWRIQRGWLCGWFAPPCPLCPSSFGTLCPSSKTGCAPGHRLPSRFCCFSFLKRSPSPARLPGTFLFKTHGNVLPGAGVCGASCAPSARTRPCWLLAARAGRAESVWRVALSPCLCLSFG